MKTPLIILSSALALVGCTRSDTDYSTGTTTSSSPSTSTNATSTDERYTSRTAGDQSAAGGTASRRSDTATDQSSTTATSPGTSTAGTPTDRSAATQPSTTTDPSTPSTAATRSADSKAVDSAVTGALGTAENTLGQKIRQAIMDDQTLATGAQDLQVSMVNGTLTLRGTVNSEELKQNIENKAKQVAGVTQIDNQLQVKSN
jgi:hypothetical protein